MIFTPYGAPRRPEDYLAETEFLDFGTPAVAGFAAEAAAGAKTPTDQAVKLFYAVRDRIRYDAFRIDFRRTTFKESTVIAEGAAFCIPKAVLLAAGARSLGIPAAIGLSDVVNHFTTPKLQAMMGDCDVFIHHGYAALYLESRWVKAAPAFNIELCDRFGTAPTEFDGRSHALLQEYDANRNLHMEYLKDHGFWSELPFDRIKHDFESYYPADFLKAAAT